MSTSDTDLLEWRKATASADGSCFELAALVDGGDAARDSKDRSGPVLSFTRPEWLAFLDGMTKGEFDHLA
jgi:hypothetical protein